jgi:hypothetical protein
VDVTGAEVAGVVGAVASVVVVGSPPQAVASRIMTTITYLMIPSLLRGCSSA